MDLGADVGSADVGWAEPAGVPPGLYRVRQNTAEVLFNGTPIPTNTLLAIHCQYGWDQPVSSADITLSKYPDAGGSYHDPVIVTVNGVLRFVGILADKDYSNWPRTVVLKARGDLCKAEEFVQSNGDLPPDQLDPGIDLTTLLGGPDSGTLKQIVLAVLTVCGVDTSNSGNWEDPPHVYGLEAPEEFTWKWGESGLAYLHKLFEASAGVRLFHSGDGLLWMASIIGRPRTGAPDLVLSQGIDILDGARMTRSISKLANIVLVTGWDDGSGFGPLTSLLAEGTAFPPNKTFNVSSSLIEDQAFADELAAFWIVEVNREITTGSIPTWRDDVMGPAQSHLIDALDRLGTGEKGWVTGLTLELNEKGEFTQTPSFVIGGVDADYTPIAT